MRGWQKLSTRLAGAFLNGQRQTHQNVINVSCQNGRGNNNNSHNNERSFENVKSLGYLAAAGWFGLSDEKDEFVAGYNAKEHHQEKAPEDPENPLGNPPGIHETLASENDSENDSSWISKLDWMDAKTAADPLSVKYLEITKRLKMAAIMQERLRESPKTAIFDNQPCSMKLIEETLLEAYQIAKERCANEDFTVLANTLSALGKFYLDFADLPEDAEFCYKNLNKILVADLKRKMSDISVLDCSIQLAKCYQFQKKYKEFATTLNWIEMTVSKNVIEMKAEFGDFSEQNLQGLPDTLIDLNYLSQSDHVKLYFDNITIKGMALEMWVNTYYKRNLPGKNMLPIAKEAVETAMILFKEFDVRVINLQSNYAIALLEDNQIDRAVEEAQKIQNSMEKCSLDLRKNPTSFIRKSRVEGWNSAVKRRGKFSEVKPFDDIFQYDSILINVILGKIWRVKSQSGSDTKLKDKKISQVYFLHAKDMCEKGRDHDVIKYVYKEMNSKQVR